MALLVVRHAHAGSRSAWEGPDRLRPLSSKGERQASDLAERFSDTGTKRILASPASRCVATVTPLAHRLGLVVEPDDRLFEGAAETDLRSMLSEIEQDHAVLCSHGDVIPDLLHLLMSNGMEPADPLRWSKASTWIVERVDGRWGSGRYVPPPAKR